MGITLSAFMGPLVCGALGESWNWHAGFSAAGVGMVLGLIQYKMGGSLLGKAGLLEEDTSTERLKRKNKNFYFILAGAALLLILFGYRSEEHRVGKVCVSTYR